MLTGFHVAQELLLCCIHKKMTVLCLKGYCTYEDEIKYLCGYMVIHPIMSL